MEKINYSDSTLICLKVNEPGPGGSTPLMLAVTSLLSTNCIQGLASHRNSKTNFHFSWQRFCHVQYFYLAKSLLFVYSRPAGCNVLFIVVRLEGDTMLWLGFCSSILSLIPICRCRESLFYQEFFTTTGKLSSFLPPGRPRVHSVAPCLWERQPVGRGQDWPSPGFQLRQCCGRGGLHSSDGGGYFWPRGVREDSACASRDSNRPQGWIGKGH